MLPEGTANQSHRKTYIRTKDGKYGNHEISAFFPVIDVGNPFGHIFFAHYCENVGSFS